MTKHVTFKRPVHIVHRQSYLRYLCKMNEIESNLLVSHEANDTPRLQGQLLKPSTCNNFQISTMTHRSVLQPYIRYFYRASHQLEILFQQEFLCHLLPLQMSKVVTVMSAISVSDVYERQKKGLKNPVK